MNYTLSEVRTKFAENKGFNVIRVGECEIRSILYNDNKTMYTNAGFYGDGHDLQKWKAQYIHSIMNSDILMDVYSCDAFKQTSKLLIDLNIWKNCVPYWEEDISFWIDLCDSLIDKEICIVSYFAPEMQQQRKMLSQIHGRPMEHNFTFIETWNTVEGNKPHENFFETLGELKKKIDKSNAEHFLISCGCYGLLLCYYIKSKNKNAIYVGGQLQLLFGLKGKRWDDRQRISTLYNEHWKYPTKKPKGFENIESGCYWGEAGKAAKAAVDTEI